MSFRKTASWLLFPLTIWYAVGVWFRNFLFSIGIKKQVAPPVTTIGVGNLSSGGTGKTPHVEYLLRLIGQQYTTAMLSRGYRRRTTGYVVDNGTHSASQLGDEAAMVARKFEKVTVAVCERRLEGVEKLLKSENPPQVIVLDDVFQHRYIKPTVNILLTEYSNPYFNDHIMPYGNLREPRSARHRANIVIVTKSPENINPIEKHSIITNLKLEPYQKVFFSHIHYNDPMPLTGTEALPLASIDAVLVVTGIANPEPMLQYVRSQCKQVRTLRYADHHRFINADIKQIHKAFEHMDGQRKLILTTEKDASRLHELNKSDILTGLPIYYLPIEVRIMQNDDYNFDKTIETLVKENVLFRDRMEKTVFHYL